MAYGTLNVDSVVNSDNVTSGGLYGFKNRIINGAMVIDQRNAGAATANTINSYVVDRWAVQQTTTGKLIAQQNSGSVTPPPGFTKYFGVVSQSAYSVVAGDQFLIQQPIEGYNVADFAYGTASAATSTVSFWARSSLTGTFSAYILLYNGSSFQSYAFTYSLPTANTWTYITATIPGNTSFSGDQTNGYGMWLRINLGAGSAFNETAGSWQAGNTGFVSGSQSVVGTNGATFYITGVQLEKGSTATSFDYRPYGTELALCQRYAASTFPIGTAWGQNKGNGGCVVFSSPGAGVGFGLQLPFRMPVTMRATPTTITTYNPAAANANARYIPAGTDLPTSVLPFGQNAMTGIVYTADTAGTSIGGAIGIHYSVEAEL